MRLLGEKGQTLIEAVIGVTILSLVMSSATMVAVSSSKAGTDSYDRLRATELAREGIERMRVYRDEWIRQNPLEDPVAQFNKWQAAFPASSSSYGPAPTGGSWSQTGSETVDGRYTRKIWMTNLEQSSSGWVNPDSYSNRLGDRKRVTSQVSWTDQSGNAQAVSLDTVLVDYQGINPTLPPLLSSPAPLPSTDELKIDVTVQTAPGLLAPTMTVYARTSTQKLNGGNPVFTRSYPVSGSSCGADYPAEERCDRYVETIHLGLYGVSDARELLNGGQVRIVFSGDDSNAATGTDNNLIINSVLLSNQSAGVALEYRNGDTQYPVSDPLAMNWNGEAFWITVSDTQPPSTPTNVSASALSSSEIRIIWNASTDNVGVTGYRVYRQIGGSWILRGTVAPSSLCSGRPCFTDSGLNGGTTYSYQVEAFDAEGNVSPRSTTVSATTIQPQVAILYDYGDGPDPDNPNGTAWVIGWHVEGAGYCHLIDQYSGQVNAYWVPPFDGTEGVLQTRRAWVLQCWRGSEVFYSNTIYHG
jgi:Tfp pilus assembly protein PilV